MIAGREQTPRVLLVDDDGTVRLAVGRMLRDLGCAVTEARDGAEGLRTFENSPFELVVTDVSMPELDGIDMLSRMRAADPTFGAVVMTSLRDQATALRAMAQGVSAFLSKPFDAADLQEKLEMAWEARERAVETSLLVDDLLHTRSSLRETLRQRDHELSRTERYLRSLLDAAPFAIVSTDGTGAVLTFNAAAEVFYGLDAEQALGRSFADLIGTTVQAGRAVHAVADGEAEVFVREQDILDDDGDVTIARLLVIEDMRERERLKSELAQADRLAMLGRLAPQVAHEFKAPLQLIQGHTDLALRDLRDGDEEGTRRHLQQVAPEVECMTRMVAQLAHLGRPAESRFVMADLREELRRTVEPLQGLGLLKGCQVHCEFEDPMPKVRVDVQQLTHLFRNLVVNAAQAMKGSRRRELGLGVQISMDGRHVEAYVRDTGVGIDADDLDAVLEPFYTTKGDAGGTGLGLAIVRTIAEQHHAELKIDSRPGVGTRMTVIFPVPTTHETPLEEHA